MAIFSGSLGAGGTRRGPSPPRRGVRPPYCAAFGPSWGGEGDHLVRGVRGRQVHFHSRQSLVGPREEGMVGSGIPPCQNLPANKLRSGGVGKQDPVSSETQSRKHLSSAFEVRNRYSMPVATLVVPDHVRFEREGALRREPVGRPSAAFHGGVVRVP